MFFARRSLEEAVKKKEILSFLTELMLFKGLMYMHKCSHVEAIKSKT